MTQQNRETLLIDEARAELDLCPANPLGYRRASMLRDRIRMLESAARNKDIQHGAE